MSGAQPGSGVFVRGQIWLAGLGCYSGRIAWGRVRTAAFAAEGSRPLKSRV